MIDRPFPWKSLALAGALIFLVGLTCGAVLFGAARFWPDSSGEAPGGAPYLRHPERPNPPLQPPEPLKHQ